MAPVVFDSLGLDAIIGATSAMLGVVATRLNRKERQGKYSLLVGMDMLFTRHIPAVTWSLDTELKILGAHGGEGVLFGFHFDAKMGVHITELVEREKRGHFEEEHMRALSGEICTIEGEYFQRYYRIALEPARGANGTIIGVNGVALDITELQDSRDQLLRERHVDDLTGLATRMRFYDRLAQAIHISARNKKNVAVLAIDLDRFKLLNETSGHALGDQLLKAVSERLRNLLRKADTLARLGSDDFAAVLLDMETAENAAIVAGKVVHAFEQPFLIAGEQIYTTVSVGVSLAPFDGDDEATLLRNAETALSYAKVTGGNVFHFYTHSMHDRISERVALESALRVALSTGELDVHYQPVVDRNGLIEGFEALARWEHATLGRLPPDRFIPLAEETGLIVQLGELVLRRACHDMAALQRRTGLPLRVAVNVSAKQFDQPNFIDSIKRIIADSEISPQSIELEITESTLMQDMQNAIATLAQIKETGVSIAIDDFGTGYSSLSHLKRLPIDTLKVDRSFVCELPDDEDAAAIVSAVCSLAHAMDLRIVAEGVETPEQVAALMEMESDLFQGYFFGRPMPIEQIVRETINTPIFANRVPDVDAPGIVSLAKRRSEASTA